MPLRLSGIIFLTAGLIFIISGIISGSSAYYGLALMSFSAGMLLIMHKPGKKSVKDKRTRKKGKFQA